MLVCLLAIVFSLACMPCADIATVLDGECPDRSPWASLESEYVRAPVCAAVRDTRPASSWGPA